MKNYTKIPNQLLEASQLSIPARLLYCILLKYSGSKDNCFPSQKTLGTDIGLSDRHVRSLLIELKDCGLIKPTRRGWNRSNTYEVTKSLNVDRKSGSPLIGNMFPFQQGSELPSNSTYLTGKANKSKKGFEQLRENMERRGLMRYKQQR